MAVTINGTNGITFNNGSTQSVGGVGIGQTWQNVASSRALGTTYTNSTGKPIVVAAQCVQTSGIEIKVDGVYAYWTQYVGNGQNAGATAIVPNGSTYVVNGSNGITFWSELR